MAYSRSGGDALTDDKITQVLTLYEDTIMGMGISAERWQASEPRPQYEKRMAHLRWMCGEAMIFVCAGRTEKAFRWLGFIQGVLWAAGRFTIEELANHGRPDEVEGCGRVK